MDKNPIYEIMGDFQVPNTDIRVLELDRDFGFWNPGVSVAEIDGAQYQYVLNSIRRWVLIRSTGSFQGKIATFKAVDDPDDKKIVPYCK